MRDKEKQRAYNRRYRQEHQEELRAYQREYRQEHREERRAYQQLYNQEHRAEIRQQQREYNEAHKEERQAYRCIYRRAHLERRRAYNRQYAREHAAEYQAYEAEYRQSARGRAVHRCNEARRKALKAGLPATLTEAEWQYGLSYFENRCAYCGASDVPLEQDHVVPLVAGGGYVARNIVPACQRCNRSKSAGALDAWANGYGRAFVLPDTIEKIGAYQVLNEVAG